MVKKQQGLLASAMAPIDPVLQSWNQLNPNQGMPGWIHSADDMEAYQAGWENNGGTWRPRPTGDSEGFLKAQDDLVGAMSAPEIQGKYWTAGMDPALKQKGYDNWVADLQTAQGKLSTQYGQQMPKTALEDLSFNRRARGQGFANSINGVVQPGLNGSMPIRPDGSWLGKTMDWGSLDKGLSDYGFAQGDNPWAPKATKLKQLSQYAQANGGLQSGQFEAVKNWYGDDNNTTDWATHWGAMAPKPVAAPAMPSATPAPSVTPTPAPAAPLNAGTLQQAYRSRGLLGGAMKRPVL